MKLKKQTYMVPLLLASLLIIAGCSANTENNSTNNTSSNHTIRNNTSTNTTNNETLLCAQDMKICSDGTNVSRDPNNNCSFPACSDEKYYISRDPRDCSVIRFLCVQGKQPFFNDEGCGCEPINQTQPSTNVTMCGTDRPEFCTKEYMPVCGLVQVQCIRAPCPPINYTFGNKCEACANRLTISYTQGACADEATQE